MLNLLFLWPFLWPTKAHRTCRCCSCCGRSSSGNRTSLTVMFTSVTLRPVRFSTRFITLLRTASVVRGICLPYSTANEKSAAASSAPTSTETPRVWLPPRTPDTAPGILSRTPHSSGGATTCLHSFYLLGCDADDLCHDSITYGGCASLALKRAVLLAPRPGPLFAHALSFPKTRLMIRYFADRRLA